MLRGVQNIKIKVIVSRLNLQQIFFMYCKIQQSNYYFYIFIFVFSNTDSIYLQILYFLLYTYLCVFNLCLCCVKTKLLPYCISATFSLPQQQDNNFSALASCAFAFTFACAFVLRKKSQNYQKKVRIIRPLALSQRHRQNS